ncbi:hypothetical protein QAD02_000434 [Eretmocerus hayati]|uniref:Uncharacterized protein n=1 Tax=Eretmocerus hayati TaxID=131215 RepID=A0ACC2NDE5_9HYME|nr:hypothetical protein QAD02_000434 [Eretmocerus hayati]
MKPATVGELPYPNYIIRRHCIRTDNHNNGLLMEQTKEKKSDNEKLIRSHISDPIGDSHSGTDHKQNDHGRRRASSRTWSNQLSGDEVKAPGTDPTATNSNILPAPGSHEETPKKVGTTETETGLHTANEPANQQ